MNEAARIAFDSTGALYNIPLSSFGIDKYVGGAFDHTVEPVGPYEGGLATEAGSDNLYSVSNSGQAVTGLTEWDSSGNRLSFITPPTGGSVFASVTTDAAHHRVFVADTGEGKIRVFSVPFQFPINVTGQGSVECEVEGGGSEPCGAYLEGTKVTLIGTPEPGYVIAGWIGCKQTGLNSCEVTFGESTEVTAIFLKEAESAVITPFSGNQHGCVNGGLEITVGTAHSYVCNGATGTNGANGQNGAAGPQGPAGKVSVTCKVKQKGKKVKVTCTVKQSASASSVHWRLMRAGHAFRHGIAGHGRLRLGDLSAGHYRLWVEGQKGATEIVIG